MFRLYAVNMSKSAHQFVYMCVYMCIHMHLTYTSVPWPSACQVSQGPHEVGVRRDSMNPELPDSKCSPYDSTLVAHAS